MDEYAERTDGERDLLLAVGQGASGIWHDQANEEAYLVLAAELMAGGTGEARVRTLLSDAYSAAVNEWHLDQDRD